ncbi:MAG: chloride channel protein [Thermoplasmata archaeon]|nr:chloride channel protein [Thermoplasmata archaeon]
MPGSFRLKKEWRLASLSILLGLLAPPVVWLLRYVVDQLFGFILALKNLPGNMGYYIILLPAALLFLLSSLITTHLAPEAEGPGLHVVIAAYFRRGGRLRPRTAPSKFISTLLTVGTGAANGLVGPLTLIGAGISSFMGRRMKIGSSEQRTLTLSGIASVISVFLGAPLAAAIFAVELVYGNRILYRRFFYPLLSSITAFVFSLFLGINPPLFISGESPSVTPISALLILLASIIVVAVNILYIHLYQKIHNIFNELHRRVKEAWLPPFMGSLAAIILLLPLYPTLIKINCVGGGRLSVDALPGAPTLTLLLVALLIMFSTSLLSGSGGSGGLFMPVFTVGAILGYALGELLHPGAGGSFIAAGISASLSTTLNVPLAAAIISMELLGEGAAFPAAVGSLAGYLLARRFIIYHEIRWEELKEESLQRGPG